MTHTWDLCSQLITGTPVLMLVLVCFCCLCLQAKQVAGKAKHRAPYSNEPPATTSAMTVQGHVGACAADVTGVSTTGGLSSSLSSFSALQEALQTCDKTYGSPVMTLKAQIDSHYSQNGRFSFCAEGNASGGYLYQVKSAATSEQQVREKTANHVGIEIY